MILKVIILGIVQGVTEFLPVSSTGHLVVLERVFGLAESDFGIFFDVMLHGGTLLALIVYFWRDLVKIVMGFLKKPFGKSGKPALLLLVGTIPAGFLGAVGEGFVERSLRTSLVVGVSLIVFSLVFFLGEMFSKKDRKMESLLGSEALFIGFCQAIALVPGVSRSGITITGGLARNLKREEAGRFAFLLSIPVVLGAFLMKILKIGEVGNELVGFSILGFLVSFIAGFLVISFFMKFLKKNSLNVFIIYRIILGILILLFMS